MKYYFSLILIFSSLYVGAQSKWSIGLAGGLNYAGKSYGIFLNTGFGELNITPGSPIDFGTEGMLSWRYGIQLGFKIEEKLSIQSGLVLNMQRVKIGALIHWINEYDDNVNFVDDPSLPNFQEIRDNHRFVEVPLHVRINFPRKRISWYLEGGFAPNIYLSTITEAYVKGFGVIEEEQNRMTFLKDVTLSFDLGFGAKMEFGEKVNIFIQPMARYFMIPHLRNRLIRSTFYNFGVEVGFQYDLD